MSRWEIHIEAWPHSTGKGADADQAAAGERNHYFYVYAEDIGEALKMAQCFAEGMESSPAVWRAPIVAIRIETRTEGRP